MERPKVIVSMTTYPARIGYVAQVLQPLLRQTVAPDKIYVWLVRDEFSNGDKEVPEELLDLAQYGVEVRWCAVNLKPHNKYFWTMLEHRDDIVITIDDDIIYPLILIQALLEMHYRHPRAVIANRTHKVCLQDGVVAPYESWTMEQTCVFDEPRHDLIATGVGGVLYPPHIFDEEVFDQQAILEDSLMADDIWLQVHELRLGIPVVNTWADPHLCYIEGSQQEGLYIQNLENGRNNTILAALFERYPEVCHTLRNSCENAILSKESVGSGLSRMKSRLKGFLRG